MSKASNFEGDAAAIANMIFQPYTTAIKALDVNVQFNKHVFEEPNVGQYLVSFANDKKRAVDFLVAYCDLMKQYALGTDWCVKDCKFPVVLPSFLSRDGEDECRIESKMR